MPSASPPRRAPRRARGLTATPARPGRVRPGRGRRWGQAASPPLRSPCPHLEGRPGPAAGAALPRGPGGGRATAAAAASPPSPWKRGAGPRRGHVDLHAEAGTGGDGPARRLRARARPPPRRVTVLAPPRLLPAATSTAAARHCPAHPQPSRQDAVRRHFVH